MVLVDIPVSHLTACCLVHKSHIISDFIPLYSDPGSVSGYSATAPNATRIRPFGSQAPIPRRIDVNNGPASSRPSFSPTRTEAPHSGSFANYTSSPMVPPHSFSMLSTPHHATSFSSPYMRHEGSPPVHFPSVGELVGEENGDNNDNTNGDNSMNSF
jgi:hypothetical protein